MDNQDLSMYGLDINGTESHNDHDNYGEGHDSIARLQSLLQKYEEVYYGDEPDEIQQPKLHHLTSDISKQCHKALLDDPNNEEVLAIFHDFSAAMMDEFYGHDNVQPENHKPRMSEYIAHAPRPDGIDIDGAVDDEQHTPYDEEEYGHNGEGENLGDGGQEDHNIDGDQGHQNYSEDDRSGYGYEEGNPSYEHYDGQDVTYDESQDYTEYEAHGEDHHDNYGEEQYNDGDEEGYGEE